MNGLWRGRRRPFWLALALAAAGLRSLGAESRAVKTGAPGVAPTPGVELARTFSEVTGIAISPLMGAAGVGVWKYAHTRPEARAALPWYAQPWYWAPAIILVGLCALKDCSGIVLPTALKKPLDVAELFENKLSALVATGAIVPLAIRAAALLEDPGTVAARTAGGHLAMIDVSWLGSAVAVPALLLIFGAVWIVSHTVHVFIALSPFGALDALLKFGKTAMLASVVATSWVNPWLGAGWAAVIALVCLRLAGWAFRLTVLGSIFGLDVLTFRSRRFRPGEHPLPAFAGSRLGRAHRRSYGRLSVTGDGRVQFSWRPWLVLPIRREFVTARDCWVGDGLLYNEIRRDHGSGARLLFLLPPRCNGHEEPIADLYQFGGVRPAGFRALWAWLRSLFPGARA